MILNRMVASISRTSSALNVFVNAIMTCYCSSHAFECLYVIVSSCILGTIYEPILTYLYLLSLCVLSGSFVTTP
jgi:hypothetical protein